MGIFTEEDVREIEALIKQVDDEERKKEYAAIITGFKIGSRRIKKTDSVTMSKRIEAQLKGILGGILGHIDGKIPPAMFGEFLGELVGILKYYPMAVLMHPDTVVSIVGAVAQLRDKNFYAYLQKRVVNWGKYMKSQAKSLNRDQLQVFAKLVKQLSV